MTTICVDKDLNMASDSRMTNDGVVISDSCKKIYKVKDYLIGFSGAYADALVFVESFAHKIEHELAQSSTYLHVSEIECEKMNTFTALVITPEQEVYLYEGSHRCFPVDTPTAIGSGEYFAKTAMMCGKTAKEAVDIAKQLDVYSGGETHVERLEINTLEIPCREDRETMSKEQLLDIVNNLIPENYDDKYEQNDERD